MDATSLDRKLAYDLSRTSLVRWFSPKEEVYNLKERFQHVCLASLDTLFWMPKVALRYFLWVNF